MPNEWNNYTSESIEKFLLDAGAYYKNVTIDTATGAFEGTLFGVTKGGGEFSCVPEIRTIEFDGKRFDTVGDKIIDKWTIKLTANLMEMTKENLKDALGAATIDGATNTAYDVIKLRSSYETADYIQNVAYVGRKSDNTPVIIVIDNALATGGVTIKTSDKSEAVLPVTFLAHAEGQEATDVPVKIYIKKAA